MNTADMTDGELLDAVYYITEDSELTPRQALEKITKLLEEAKQ